MSFDRENMLLLLLSIRHSNASFFVSQHLSYGFVGDLCEEAIRKGFLIESRKELQLRED